MPLKLFERFFLIHPTLTHRPSSITDIQQIITLLQAYFQIKYPAYWENWSLLVEGMTFWQLSAPFFFSKHPALKTPRIQFFWKTSQIMREIPTPPAKSVQILSYNEETLLFYINISSIVVFLVNNYNKLGYQPFEQLTVLIISQFVMRSILQF